MARALVVYYSRTGITERAAITISRTLSAELERIIDPTARGGVGGYLRSAVDATFGRLAPIAEPVHSPARYDITIIGTPVWNGSPSSPTRAYIERQRGLFNNVAFFCTCASGGTDKALWEMSRLCRLAPSATLVLREADVLNANYKVRLDGFVRAILSALESHPLPGETARGWGASSPAWER